MTIHSDTSSFSEYDKITQESLQHLSTNEEFQFLWDKIQCKWGESLTFQPFYPTTPKEYEQMASTDYDNKGVTHPSKVSIRYNASAPLKKRTFYLLLELCNVERLPDYVRLDLSAAKYWPEDFAIQREKIEWEVFKKTYRLSQQFTPSLRKINHNLVISFDDFLNTNRKNGHVQNYKKLWVILVLKNLSRLFLYPHDI